MIARDFHVRRFFAGIPDTSHLYTYVMEIEGEWDAIKRATLGGATGGSGGVIGQMVQACILLRDVMRAWTSDESMTPITKGVVCLMRDILNADIKDIKDIIRMPEHGWIIRVMQGRNPYPHSPPCVISPTEAYFYEGDWVTSIYGAAQKLEGYDIQCFGWPRGSPPRVGLRS